MASSSSALATGPSTVAEAWVPPAERLGPADRGRDFARFTELQIALKQSCASLLHFVARDFGALAACEQKLADLAKGLGDCPLAESVRRFVPSMQMLTQRIEAREKLRVVFIGPVKAGKSTLINVLLTAHLGTYEMLLPVDESAATNCIWKVESCEGSTAAVLLSGSVLREWQHEPAGDAAAASAIRTEMAEFLEMSLGRSAAPSNRQEVTLRLPRTFLDPFGCHYSLVDTPGYTESEEYESLVTKFLQDHSHIACMVCPLTEGTAVPQATKNMLQKSYSRKFWVLTRYDSLLLNARPRPGQSRRQRAENTVGKFREDILSVDANARIFLHAAQALMPEEGMDGWCNVMNQHLPCTEALSWLCGIQSHVKECFLAIQQEQHVLSSQSRQCVDVASEVYQEYNKLRDGMQGTLAVSDHCMLELQTGTEEAAAHLEREIRKEIERVTSLELPRLCKQAGEEARQVQKTFISEQAYYNALLERLVPAVDVELKQRFATVVARAQQRVVEVAQHLLREAGMDCSVTGPEGTHQDIFTPGSGHLDARYPMESVVALSLASAATGTAALTEAGAALLATFGLRAGAVAVAGGVGAAVAVVATAGYTVKKAAEFQPFWKYSTVESDAAEKLKSANHWTILAEAFSGRARSQLLSNVARFRCRFSAMLLARGTPRDILVKVFPDLPLFEEIRTRLEQTCTDIGEFVDAPDLASRARDDVQFCSEHATLHSWPRVVDTTQDYVGRNARTDSVDAGALAVLLAFRCQALVKTGAFGEAAHTARLFQQLFPELDLPRVYGVATQVLFDYFAGVLDQAAALQRVRVCTERLEHPDGVREVPQLVELWFHAVVASYLGQAAQATHLGHIAQLVECLVAVQMKGRPSLEEIRGRAVEGLRARTEAIGKELTSDLLRQLDTWKRSNGVSTVSAAQEWDDVKRLQELAEIEYQRELAAYVTGVANSIHLMLSSLPPAQIDMDNVGRPVVVWILRQVDRECAGSAPVEPPIATEIRALLCPVDAGNVPDLCEEWIRLLGAAIKDFGPSVPAAE